MPSASRFTRQSSRIGASSSITSTFVIANPLSAAVVHTLRAPFSLAPSRAGDRQLDHEARARALSRRDPDPSAHRRHEALRDEEPEPGAARPRGLAVGPVELREDPLLLGRRDARCPRRRRAARRCRRARRAATVTVPPDGRVADGVVDQVAEDLARASRRRPGRRAAPRGRSTTKRWPFSVVAASCADVTASRDDGAHVGRRELHLEVAGLEPRDVEQLVDDRRSAAPTRRRCSRGTSRRSSSPKATSSRSSVSAKP